MRSCELTKTFRSKSHTRHMVLVLVYPTKQPVVDCVSTLLLAFWRSLGTWMCTIQPKGFNTCRSDMGSCFWCHFSYEISSLIASLSNRLIRYAVVEMASAQKDLGILAWYSIARAKVSRVRFSRSALPFD